MHIFILFLFHQKGACRFSQNNIGANVSGYNSTRSGDENDLKLALAFIGPVSVCVRVTRNFQSYRGGSYKNNNKIIYKALNIWMNWPYIK